MRQENLPRPLYKEYCRAAKTIRLPALESRCCPTAATTTVCQTGIGIAHSYSHSNIILTTYITAIFLLMQQLPE